MADWVGEHGKTTAFSDFDLSSLKPPHSLGQHDQHLFSGDECISLFVESRRSIVVASFKVDEVSNR
jgi:hypothetical protein